MEHGVDIENGSLKLLKRLFKPCLFNFRNENLNSHTRRVISDKIVEQSYI